jgi:ABC-type uncharacterized transport system permease subunit
LSDTKIKGRSSFGTRAGARAGALAITLASALAAAVILIAAFSGSFWDALALFFLGPFKNAYYFGNMLNASVALALAGLGIGVAFASRNFNLGGEGQVYVGAIATTFACLALPEGGLAPIAAAMAGALAGALMGALSGWLKRSLGVDELISSFLASAAFVYLGDYLITGPLQDPSSNFQTTLAVPAAYRLVKLLPPSSLNTGCLVALAAVAGIQFLMGRTRFGYELRLSGQNRDFARYVGVDTGRYEVAPMAISGALHGLAGALMILGTYYKAMKGFSSGVGWGGIAVALIAGNAPWAAIPAALLFAYLDAGAKAVMVGADLTSEIVAVVQAVVFFLVTAKALEAPFLRRRRGGSP